MNIHLRNIQHRINQNKSIFDSWRENELKTAEKISTEINNQIDFSRKKLKENYDKIFEQEQLNKKKSQLIEKRDLQLNFLKNEISIFTEKKNNLLESKTELKKKIQELEVKISEKRLDIEKNFEITQKDESLSVSLFERILGLELMSEACGGLTFIFTNIPGQRKDRKYSLTLKCENEAYQLIYCDPFIPSIQELTNELNQNFNMALYIKTVRQCFSELPEGYSYK